MGKRTERAWWVGGWVVPVGYVISLVPGRGPHNYKVLVVMERGRLLTVILKTVGRFGRDVRLICCVMLRPASGGSISARAPEKSRRVPQAYRSCDLL